MSKNQLLNNAIAKNPVVPVLTLESVAHAETLALKLSQEGYSIVEVTLRSDSALVGISTIKEKFPDLVIGAGTILSIQDAEKAIYAGADFLVTPATPFSLGNALLDVGVPVIPGISTATEASALYELGYERLKLFPVEAYGGVKMLKALSAPLPHLKFMPSGGVRENTASDYLALPNVFAVGGSWMTK